MTKGELYAAINSERVKINELNGRIAVLKIEKEELTDTKTKLESLATKFEENKNHSVSQLAETGFMTGKKSKVVDRFFAGMTEIFTGVDYTSKVSGLETAISTVLAEINKKQADIDNCYAQINQCNSNIASYEAQIRAIEEAERRAAEEAARRASAK